MASRQHMGPPDDPGAELISPVTLRRMSAEEWREVLAGPPASVALYVRSAAEHGFRTAQVTWAQMLLNGQGVARDPEGALRWFGRAAALGSPDGVNMVGRCHELGWGTPVDHREAARWFRKAADLGSDWGAYNLGCLYLYGEGFETDHRKALGWFRIAAEAGNAKAMGMVARALEEGWGTEPDPFEAVRWYRRAAEAGDCWAAFNLATLLLGAEHREEALGWLDASLASGTPNYLRAAGAELEASEDPDLQAVGRRALARAEELSGGPADEPRPRGFWTGLRRLGRGRASGGSGSPARR